MKSKKKNLLVLCLVILFTFTTIGCSNSKKQDNEAELIKNYQVDFKNGERFFKSEVAPTSIPETVILDVLKIEINDEYDKLNDLYSFNPLSDNYKKNFDDGEYTEEMTVHSFEKISKEVYTNVASGIKYYGYIDKLKPYNDNEIQVIGVNYTNKLTDKANAGAQGGNGNWTRYYVLTQENSKAPWKILDIYGHM
ncbi:DUF4829 domain-containing protein [Clostridium sp.]|uniref:DUF4829 domain-containing protein n=1 Tax=Clostridium sp. TaxID=1506 RepID=UPI003216E905